MLHTEYVDVAVIFRYDLEGEDDGMATRRLLDEPSHLVTASEASPDLADHADAEWIAGCDRCRPHLPDMRARARASNLRSPSRRMTS
jgi:DNA-binding transcriptional LysR family regulator